MIPRNRMSRELRAHLQKLEDQFRKRRQRRHREWTARDRRAQKALYKLLNPTCAVCTSGKHKKQKTRDFLLSSEIRNKAGE